METTTTDALSSFLAQDFQKLADLASAFAHQREHREVGGGAARHHANQRALAYAAAAEDAQPLPAAAGKKSVDGANAAAQRFADRQRSQRERHRRVQRPSHALGSNGAGHPGDVPGRRSPGPAAHRRQTTKAARPSPQWSRQSECRWVFPGAWSAPWYHESRPPRRRRACRPHRRNSQHSPTVRAAPPTPPDFQPPGSLARASARGNPSARVSK